jgi:KUP system potassium uptake protein
VSAVVDNVPHVDPRERVSVEIVEPAALGILRVTLRFGFKDEQNIPMALLTAQDPRLHHEHSQSVYYLSRIDIERGAEPTMISWRKRLFVWMVHNSASPIGYFYLPQSRTVSLGSTVHL